MTHKEGRIGTIISVALHVGGFFLILSSNMLFSSSVAPPDPTPLCTIPLDVVAESDISQAPPPKPKIAADPTPKEEARDNLAQDFDRLIEEHPPIEKPLDPVPVPKEEIKKKKPKPKKSPKANKGEKNRGRDRTDFLNVLKDVNKTRTDESVIDSPDADPNSQSPHIAPRRGARLAMSVVDRIRRMLEKCWRIPPGAYGNGHVVVIVHIETNPDGSIRSARVLDGQGTPHHPLFKISAENALRAVFHCSPLPIPKNQWEHFKSFDFRFDTTPRH